LGYARVFIASKFSRINVFQVWEGGFESNNSDDMVARRVVTKTNISRTIRIIDVGEMVKLHYETTINLFLLTTFVAFVAFSSHPTINKE
jgi:hypothetical protein